MGFIRAVIFNFWDMLTTSGYWLIFSFFLAGLLHNVLDPSILQKNLGNTKFSSLTKATVSGALLPVCSCGVMPLGISLYYSGAYLGPTLAFLIATPVINPAALLLSYAFLGPQITVFYLAAGLVIPIIAGVLGNKFGGDKLFLPQNAPLASLDNLEEEKVSWSKKLVSGVKWGYLSLGKEVGKFVVLGVALAAIILTVVPVSWIQRYLSQPDMMSIFGIALIGAMMYVCAVGHIPFIAAIVASGAAPGIALTFLLSGAATNLPELISLSKLIGKRVVFIYCSVVVVMSFIFGYITNMALMPGFKPVFDVQVNQGLIKMASTLNFQPPELLQNLCAGGILVLFAFTYVPKIKNLILKPKIAR